MAKEDNPKDSKSDNKPSRNRTERSSNRGSGRRRSRSRDKDRNRDRDKERNKDRNRDRDKDRDRKQSSPKRPKKMRKARKISDHFSRKDFSCRCGECQDSLRLSLGLVGGLELLRSKAQHRINIVKGFMCQTSAEKEGKLRRNFHATGVAADITVDDMTPQQVFRIALDIPEFKGLGLADDHVHVDTRKEADRTLWVEKDGDIIDVTDDTVNEYLEPVSE